MVSGKVLFALGLLCLLWKCLCGCEEGWSNDGTGCVDTDECLEKPCGDHSKCFNTIGSFYCQCCHGYSNDRGMFNFTVDEGQCIDTDECLEKPCGDHSKCFNTIGSFYCLCSHGFSNNGTLNFTAGNGRCQDDDECHKDICGVGGNCTNLPGTFKCNCSSGFTNNTQGSCIVDECQEAEDKREDLCGGNGTCTNGDWGYWCMCSQGYTNYGKERTQCSKFDCNNFNADSGTDPSSGGLADILFMMRNNCLALSNPSVSGEARADGEALLEKLFTATETILSSGHLKSTEDVSKLLSVVENSIRLVGLQLRHNYTKLETTKTDAEIAVQWGRTPPIGPIHLTNEYVTLDTDWTTAAGRGPYPGFALAALLSYKNLELSSSHSFKELTEYEKDGLPPSFQVSSKVVSVVVSNPSTQNLSRPVNITLRHLQDVEESPGVKYICVYWSERGTWSTDGCYQGHSNATHTVCTCEHLSSFAVLMALYPMKHPFALQVLTKIGLTISLLCLMLCILTFQLCRSIQGTRNTIHLHLCVCLFVADLFLLAGISQTEPVGGCRFIAVMLHFFYLGVFTWMLLEGVQLYHMVVLVFNASMRPLHLFLVGYGTPLLIVLVSVIIRSNGYGTDEHCWLSLKDGLIWSFFGPVCFIIILNIFFFIVTVWRLAQKFSSINPDLSKLQKIKAFTATAIAQLCILGLMWVFGAFLFEEGPIAIAYIFTILNSLQGALVFIMHCLLSKQVREDYAYLLSRVRKPQRKGFSEFSSTNPSNSQSQGSRSGQHTGESQI